MEVKGKSIRSAKRVFDAALKIKNSRFSYRVKDSDTDKLESIGFNDLPVGSHAIPSPIGIKTRENSEGKEIILKNEKKENLTRSVYKTWNDWHGHQHSGFQDISYKAYPRKIIHPTLHELYVVKVNKDIYICSDSIKLKEKNNNKIIEVANIMLECFGSFEILDSENMSLSQKSIDVINWEILPSGTSPWSNSVNCVNFSSKPLNIDRKIAIEYRFNSVNKFAPDFVARGHHGFNGYYIFGFKSKNIFILESIYLNNATYILSDNWEKLSSLTKSQLINGDFDYLRIIHNNQWPSKIIRLLRN